MGVVSGHEDAIRRDRNSAVHALRAAALDPWRAPALVVPYLPSTARVESKALIRFGHIHDSIDHYRGSLRLLDIGQGKDPLGL